MLATVKPTPEQILGRRSLKVKIKSLAEEARIIRMEERRSKGFVRDQLHNHRVIELRREARATHVAYAYIRNKPLHGLYGADRPFGEAIAHIPLIERVKQMVKKYGHRGANYEVDLIKWMRSTSVVQPAFNPAEVGSIPAAS